MPRFPSRHCACEKSTKRAVRFGYCPKCCYTCEGKSYNIFHTKSSAKNDWFDFRKGNGSAKTQSGRDIYVEHERWVVYHNNFCDACNCTIQTIQATPYCKLAAPMHSYDPVNIFLYKEDKVVEESTEQIVTNEASV